MTRREKMNLIGGVLAGLAVSIGTMVLLLLPVIDALN